MGIDSVEDDKFCYRAVLEITSYFWASKGGRGTLLEIHTPLAMSPYQRFSQ